MMTIEERAVISFVRLELRNLIADMEREFGADRAYPVTRHALAAMEATKQLEAQHAE